MRKSKFKNIRFSPVMLEKIKKHSEKYYDGMLTSEYVRMAVRNQFKKDKKEE